MARRPDGAEPRTEYIRVRTTKSGKALVEILRGTENVSDYTRRLYVEDARRRGVTLPKEK